MKIKNLIRILFIIIGLYFFLKLLIEFFSQQLTYILNSDLYFPNDQGANYQIWIYFFINIFFIIILFYFFVLNPDIIINQLKPKNFFDVEINLSKFNTLSMIKISILTIGTLILVENIPNFINSVFVYFKLNEMNSKGGEDINTLNYKIDLIMNGIKVFLGLILLIFYSQIGKNLYKNNVVE